MYFFIIDYSRNPTWEGIDFYELWFSIFFLLLSLISIMMVLVRAVKWNLVTILMFDYPNFFDIFYLLRKITFCSWKVSISYSSPSKFRHFSSILPMFIGVIYLQEGEIRVLEYRFNSHRMFNFIWGIWFMSFWVSNKYNG